MPGLLPVGYIRLIGWVSFHRVHRRGLLIAPSVAFTLLGVAAIGYPQVPGNGKDLAHWAFGAGGQPTFTLMIALVRPKPAATALCLGSGATGGLFTPTMSAGRVVGLLFGRLWIQLWPGSPLGADALIAAAAMIGAAMQTPRAALALVIQLTHTARHPDRPDGPGHGARHYRRPLPRRVFALLLASAGLVVRGPPPPVHATRWRGPAAH